MFNVFYDNIDTIFRQWKKLLPIVQRGMSAMVRAVNCPEFGLPFAAQSSMSSANSLSSSSVISELVGADSGAATRQRARWVQQEAVINLNDFH